MAEPSQYVWPYDIETLCRCFAEFSGKNTNTPEVVRAKFHKTYFESYFSVDGLDAKTFVVEREYVDSDFLEDYAAYYVKCFQQYDRFTSRFHFFSVAFTQEAFEGLLLERKEIDGLTLGLLNEKYLGFVVIKHLPGTIIGRTCLKTYNDVNDDVNCPRHYPVKRPYTVHLFGIDLTVNTLAFQEQDRAAAACATSALWSAFQGTGPLFHHKSPCPIEITKAASKHIPSATRTLPNHGLSVTQMVDATRKVGLEPSLIQLGKAQAAKTALIKATVYAYLKLGVPILMGVSLSNGGLHAVAVTGFSLGGKPTPEKNDQRGLVLKSSRMDKIYAHDDQIGPFARMIIDPEQHKLQTSWPDDQGNVGNIYADPIFLLLPLYHKVRVTLEQIRLAVGFFSSLLSRFFDAMPAQIRERFRLPVMARFEWDVHLTKVDMLKKDVRDASCIGLDYKKEVAIQSMPKYMWRVGALVGDERVFDLLFDATDVETGRTFLRAIEYNIDYAWLLRVVCAELTQRLPRLPAPKSAWHVLEWFSDAYLGNKGNMRESGDGYP